MKLLPVILALIIANSCFSQTLHPPIKALMQKKELNTNYQSLFDAKPWVHQPSFKLVRLNSKLSSEEGDKADTAQPNTGTIIHHYRINVQKISNDSARTIVNKEFGLKKIPGTYRLWLDNMPCIVPDTKDIVSIPNAWPGRVPDLIRGMMPNPALPLIRRWQYR
jgi:hypothetical protein